MAPRRARIAEQARLTVRPPFRGIHFEEGATALPAGEAATLFDRLRALRLELARAAGVTPYVVFHDATLREMALLRPTTVDQLAQIPGVGESKLKRYGAAFLALLQDTEEVTA